MRHTLLPTSERMSLRREYRSRLAVVLCFMLSVALLMGAVSLLPAYVRARMAVMGARTTTASAAASGDSAATRNLAIGQSLLARIGQDVGGTRASALVSRVVAARGSVDLTGISVSSIATTSATLALQGVAPSRDTLLSFRARLEALVPGGKVDLPVSQLVKDRDIQFALSLTLPLP